PEVLCMDEPFSGLDVLTADNLRSELMDLWLEKKIPTKAILAITHSIEEAVMMADKVVIFWHNPGRVAAVLKVGLPHPREKKSPEFKKLIDQIYTILVRQAEVETKASQRPLALRKFQKLPHARLGALSGLLDLIQERGGVEDIYELEGELNMEADDLLELTEAASVLGLAVLSEGDIKLTQLGMRFVEGDILSRKDVFREAVAGSVVVINQILQALNTATDHSMDEEYFLDVLENHFTEDEAYRQLQTAIDWGRYAELFAYDEQSGVLYLEDPPEEEG
ncbi:MAG TPA: AAA-associated domain-containing protein, partial [Myxococcota bacterium]|nr:AAA-associated domain-containing protein [Myxococcota bacterium]